LQIVIQDGSSLLNFHPPRAYSSSNFTIVEDGRKRILGFRNDSMIVSYIVVNNSYENDIKPLVDRVEELGKFTSPDITFFNTDSTIIYTEDSDGRFKAVLYRIGDTDFNIVTYKFYPHEKSEYDEQFDLIIERFDLKE
jgi:hypothetical protein